MTRLLVGAAKPFRSNRLDSRLARMTERTEKM
jgi:hypothetical protein